MLTRHRSTYEEAAPVARELCAALKPVTQRLCVAGSLRRGSPTVGDIELLFIPATEERKVDLFNVEAIDLAAESIERLLKQGVLAKRRAADCRPAGWGPKNKLAVHVASGLPVDMFAATEENWWNYLVCRTGPVALNRRICALAEKKGWRWNPYGPGFSRPGAHEFVAVESEAAVFEFVGLPFKRPGDRYTLCGG